MILEGQLGSVQGLDAVCYNALPCLHFYAPQVSSVYFCGCVCMCSCVCVWLCVIGS